MTRRAIVFGVHPWGGPFKLGAHHLASALGRAGFETLYVAAPLSPPHMAALPFSARARLRFSEMLRPPRPAGVRVLTPFTWTPLSAKWGADDAGNLQRWPERSSVLGYIRALGFEAPDLALIDGPLQLAAARAVRPRRLVLRVFDRFTHMPGATPALLDLAAEAVRGADLTIYSARALEADAAALGAKRTLFLPNGVETAHFAKPAPAPAAYAAIARPRAVYVGQTGPLFDAEMLAESAAARPQISFVIIGPTAPTLAPLRALANVHLLGPVAYENLPAYLQHADFGLAPFAADRYPDYVSAVNPLKIYEYLATGLPAAATRWDELAALEAPDLFLAARANFPAALDAANAAAAEPAGARRAFAQGASWDRRVETLLAALD